MRQRGKAKLKKQSCVLNEENHCQIGKADEEDQFCKAVASRVSPLCGLG